MKQKRNKKETKKKQNTCYTFFFKKFKNGF